MTKSRELDAGPASNRALLKQFTASIARSSKNIGPGELAVIDRHGVAVDRARVRRWNLALRLGMAGAAIGGGALWLAGAVIPGVLLYSVGALPLLVMRWRGTATLTAIEVLARQGHLDEAQRRLDAAASLRRRNPLGYGMLAGSLASHRGEHAAALRWWREAFPRTRGLQRELTRLVIVRALLLDGQVAAARPELAAVVLPADADEILTGLTLTRAMVVLLDPEGVGVADDDLHDWARRALEYSHTGVSLAALGLAFERRGDSDMAVFLAHEALDRVHYRHLASHRPASHDSTSSANP